MGEQLERCKGPHSLEWYYSTSTTMCDSNRLSPPRAPSHDGRDATYELLACVRLRLCCLREKKTESFCTRKKRKRG